MVSQLELKKLALRCKRLIINSNIKKRSYYKKPFKHLIIDDFLDIKYANACLKNFPKNNSEQWEHSNVEDIEIKSRTKWKSEFDIPEKIIDVVRLLNSSIILNSISSVLEIPKLMPDPYFTGGGLNNSLYGGKLDIHIDGNYHDASGMNRRVNAILYLNKNWHSEWGGEFGVYANNGNKLVRKIIPKFNRLVIFDTHDKSFHGIVNPVSCPKTQSRKSLILYYYTVAKRDKNQIYVDKPHSALWKKKLFKDKNGKLKRKFY